MSHIRAPAKINLGLKIVGVRKDGYHLLQSLFAPINLYDEISIKPDPPGQEHDRVSYIIGGRAQSIENDTISTAVRLFRAVISAGSPPVESSTATRLPLFDIIVQKAIPIGAGLGGGSSDAGAVLRYLYKTYSPTLMAAELVKIALIVGADVPFFLKPQPAWVTGVGEHIEPVDLEPLYVLVCKPPFSISTPAAFAWYDQEISPENGLLTPKMTDATSMGGTEVLERQEPQQKTTWTVRQVIDILENDLEKPVETRHPEIQKMRLALRQWGALGSLMSGTGSSVYGLFRNNAEAVVAREKLTPRYPSTYSFFICETVQLEN